LHGDFGGDEVLRSVTRELFDEYGRSRGAACSVQEGDRMSDNSEQIEFDDDVHGLLADW